MWRKGSPCTVLMGMGIGTAIMKSSMDVPQKIKTRTTRGLVISPLGVQPKKMKPGSPTGVCSPMFTAAWPTIAKMWPQRSVHWWMSKGNVTHAHTHRCTQIYTVGYYSAFREDVLPSAVTWVRLEDKNLCGISPAPKGEETLHTLSSCCSGRSQGLGDGDVEKRSCWLVVTKLYPSRSSGAG